MTGGPHSDALMPPGFEQFHPGGMIENSPAFQRWDGGDRALSPEGTVEDHRLSRPFGTNPCDRAHPALKRWAILICPSGTGKDECQAKIVNHSSFGGIGALPYSHGLAPLDRRSKALRPASRHWRVTVICSE